MRASLSRWIFLDEATWAITIEFRLGAGKRQNGPRRRDGILIDTLSDTSGEQSI